MVCFLVSNSYENSMKRHRCPQKMSNPQEEKETVPSSVHVLSAEEMALQSCCFSPGKHEWPQGASLHSLSPLLMLWSLCTDKSSLQISMPVSKDALVPFSLMQPLFISPHFSNRIHFKFNRAQVRWISHVFSSLVWIALKLMHCLTIWFFRGFKLNYYLYGVSSFLHNKRQY